MKKLNPRDRVNRIINHKEADRVPLDIWAEEVVKEKLIKRFGFDEWEQVLRQFNIDIRWPAPWIDHLPLRYTNNNNCYIDSWGIEHWAANGMPTNFRWANIESVNDIDKIIFPDPNNFDYDNYAKECKGYHESGYFICGGSWNCFLTTASFLVGFENIFVKMIDIPEVISYLFEKITDFYLEVSRKMYERANKWIDISFMGDDFGTQESLLISKPMFEKLLIENGLDVLNPIQPRIEDMNIINLKKEFGERIAFHGSIDTQYILPSGTENDVKNEVIEKIINVASGGGFVLSTSHYLQNDVPINNIITMYETAYNYGFYNNLGKFRKYNKNITIGKE